MYQFININEFFPLASLASLGSMAQLLLQFSRVVGRLSVHLVVESLGPLSFHPICANDRV